MRQKERYDRTAVGGRLRNRRTQLSWSRKYVADKVGLVEKYYADIERGTCGMSVETLMALADLYGFTIDGLIYGEKSGNGILANDNSLLEKLNNLSPRTQNTCRQLLDLFVNGILIENQENTTSPAGEMLSEKG